MKLCRASEMPLGGRLQVYKQSVLSAIVGLLFVGGGTAAMAVGIVRGALPGLLWIMVAVLGLISLLFVGMLRAAMGPDNWVLKTDGSEVAFKFRSYLNRHFPAEDRVVAVMPLTAIESVGKHVERIKTPGVGKKAGSQETWVSLDFRLKDEAAARELDAAIREEIAREAPKIGRGRTKHHHAPMRIVEGRILRVYWRSPRDYVRPGIDAALRHLGGGVRLEAEDRSEARRWEDLKDEEREAYVLELAQRGKRMEAVTLVREMYGVGLGEARQHVDELVRSGAGIGGKDPGGSIGL